MILTKFLEDLEKNGISEDEVVKDISENVGMAMFRMPYKGMAITVWLYDDVEYEKFCIRTTAVRNPEVNNGELLVALNTKNAEVDEYRYFIDPDYPKEVGVGILPEITSIADIYTEIFMSCDTILEELKEFVEIHEE